MSGFPWKEAKNVYESAGPKEGVTFGIEGIYFFVAPTDKKGRDTGRTRYMVACVNCDCILHAETTGPSSRVRSHMQETHGMDRETKIAYE